MHIKFHRMLALALTSFAINIGMGALSTCHAAVTIDNQTATPAIVHFYVGAKEDAEKKTEHPLPIVDWTADQIVHPAHTKESYDLMNLDTHWNSNHNNLSELLEKYSNHKFFLNVILNGGSGSKTLRGDKSTKLMSAGEFKSFLNAGKTITFTADGQCIMPE